jgi:hypothetical protein
VQRCQPSVASAQGHRTEKIGSDPLTVCVVMAGSLVSFVLVPSVAL